MEYLQTPKKYIKDICITNIYNVKIYKIPVQTHYCYYYINNRSTSRVFFYLYAVDTTKYNIYMIENIIDIQVYI